MGADDTQLEVEVEVEAAAEEDGTEVDVEVEVAGRDDVEVALDGTCGGAGAGTGAGAAEEALFLLEELSSETVYERIMYVCMYVCGDYVYANTSDYESNIIHYIHPIVHIKLLCSSQSSYNTVVDTCIHTHMNFVAVLSFIQIPY